MEYQYRILHIEDSETDAELIELELRDNEICFDYLVVDTSEQYKKALDEFKPDVILSDHTLPTFNSFEALRLLKQKKLNIPFIVITATMTEDVAITIVREGADDYILKDRLKRLPHVVLNAIDKYRYEKERKQIIDEAYEKEAIAKELQEQLSSKLLLATKSAGIGIWDWNLKTGNLDWDDGMMRLYNITDSDFGSNYYSWLIRFHPEDKQRVYDEIESAIKGKTIYDTEYRILWQDSSVHYIKANGTVERDEKGKAIRMLGVNQDITKSKKAEQEITIVNEALEQALSELRKIMDSSVDIICSIDKDGKFANVSSAAEKILGYQPFELIGRKHIDFTFEDDRNETLSMERAILGGERITMFENRYTRKDGSTVPLLWSAKWDDNDKVMYCVVKDATEKKRLEKALAGERLRFFKLFYQAPLSIGVLKGADHVYEFANLFYLDFIGKKNIIGKTVQEVLPEVVEQGFIKILDDVYNTGNSFIADEVPLLLTKNEEPHLFYVNIVYQVYRDSEDNIEGIFFFTIDVTEQVLSRKKIEKSEKRFRQIIETAQEGIWMTDENSKTTFTNQKLCEILGFTEQEMIGRTSFSFKAEDEQQNAILHEQKRRMGLNVTFDCKYITKTGELIYAHVSSNPVFSEDGTYAGALAMLTDITDRKKVEMEKAKLVNDLVMRNKDLEQFTYIVSHNLRAPVANLMGMTNLLNVDNIILSMEDKEFMCHGIYESANKLDMVVKDLNQILQVKNAYSEIKEKVCFSKLIHDIKVSINNILTDDVQINCDFTEVDHFVTIKSYLYSVFYNLITNAIKYRRHHVFCIINIQSFTTETGIGLTVSDNGMGIDLTLRGDDVFGLYKRFHTNVEGKGIGLFMVKTQVEAIKGKISIDSEVDKGTVFKIRFEV